MRLRRSAGAAAIGAGTVALFFISRGKWSDALIDSGREWIVPDALSRGEVLYRDVVYWFGPFTPYFHAAIFRVLGSGFSALVVAGAIGAALALAALWFAVRKVAGRAEAALAAALAVPVLVFMPDAGGALLGMGYRIWHAAALGLAALALAGSVGPRRAETAAAAGALAAMAGLCRTEWGLMVFLGATVVVLRASSSGRAARFGWLAAAFVATLGAGWAFFVVRAGWGRLVGESPVFLFDLPDATRSHVVRGGAIGALALWNFLYSCCLWAAVLLVLDLVSWPRGSRTARRRLPWLAAVLVLAAVSGLRGALSGAVAFSAAPAVCAAAAVVGWRRGRRPRAALLLGFGVTGLLALHRRFVFIGDGPYVAPPLLFTLVCAAGLVWQLEARRGTRERRRRFHRALQIAAVFLIAAAFLDRTARYALDDRVPIRGTQRMLSASPEVASAVEETACGIRGLSKAGGGLVVFPEGELLNYLSGWRNPIRHKLYLPGYLSPDSEPVIRRELEAAMPEAIVILARSTGEYGGGAFGQGYGAMLREWIDRHYEPRSRTTLGLLYVPRGSAAGGAGPPP